MSQGRFAFMRLLGPAIVAGVAYLDPGNVATNLTAGSKFGFLLVWVIVVANLAASLIQYLSAKLGIVTGQNLPEILGKRFKSRFGRLAFWVQAELVAMATDLAEVIGGALALYLLFDLPLFVGGLITGAVSLALLQLNPTGGRFGFQSIMIGLVTITALGFIAGVFFGPPAISDVVGGLVPQFTDETSLLIAVGILGATIMPHAIYAHSALAKDRFGDGLTNERKSRLLSATKLDVAIAMTIAGLANLAILLTGAVTLFGVADTDTIPGAHAAFEANLGPVAALIFAIGLLASGLASTSVGAYSGAAIMDGLLRVRIPVFYRRLISLIPAMLILLSAADATWALVLSQVVLSFGIPFALFPLIRFTSNSTLMGKFVNRRLVTALGYLIAVLVSGLNLVLLVLTFS